MKTRTKHLLVLLLMCFVAFNYATAERYMVYFQSKHKIVATADQKKKGKVKFKKPMENSSRLDITVEGQLVIYDTEDNVSYRLNTPQHCTVKEAIKKAKTCSNKQASKLDKTAVTMPKSTYMQTTGDAKRGTHDTPPETMEIHDLSKEVEK